ncbi:PncA Amidase to nicotinamidase [Pyrenophora tritici-repentis]|nr:PncA Amidase to nicotinamidase [Pyrenophora tritici-repentis]
MSFKPALVVVDMQEDFAASLAVTGGRDIVPTINEFLEYPFALKVATKDYHPRDHISFASNHTAPNNKPFESTVTIKNPHTQRRRRKRAYGRTTAFKVLRVQSCCQSCWLVRWIA